MPRSGDWPPRTRCPGWWPPVRAGRPREPPAELRQRPGRSQPKRLLRRHAAAPCAHTETGQGHFKGRECAEHRPIDQDMPPLVEEGCAQPQPQKAAGVEPEQHIEDPAEQDRVPEDERPDAQHPLHGRPSALAGSYRIPCVRNSKCRWAPVDRPVCPAVPRHWPADTTSPART